MSADGQGTIQAMTKHKAGGAGGKKKTTVSMTTPQARRRRAKIKAATLAVKHEAQATRVQAQLDEWFENFDANGDQQFNREELLALLTHLNPGAPPSSGTIDMVMRDATGVYAPGTGKTVGNGVYEPSGRRTVLAGDVNGLVHRDKLMPTVKKYSAYVREQAKIDAIFDKFDEDHSGMLVRRAAPRLPSPSPALPPTTCHVSCPRPGPPPPTHGNLAARAARSLLCRAGAQGAQADDGVARKRGRRRRR